MRSQTTTEYVGKYCALWACLEMVLSWTKEAVPNPRVDDPPSLLGCFVASHA